MQLDGSMQDAARACATDTAADLKPWRQAGVELFPPWFDNSRVRHAGLPQKAAVPPLGPVWPLPPIAGSEFSPSSGYAHYNKTISHDEQRQKSKSSVLNSNQRIMSPTEFSIDFHKISQFGQNHLPRTSSCLECAGRQCACHAAVHPSESQT